MTKSDVAAVARDLFGEAQLKQVIVERLSTPTCQRGQLLLGDDHLTVVSKGHALAIPYTDVKRVLILKRV